MLLVLIIREILRSPCFTILVTSLLYSVSSLIVVPTFYFLGTLSAYEGLFDIIVDPRCIVNCESFFCHVFSTRIIYFVFKNFKSWHQF